MTTLLTNNYPIFSIQNIPSVGNTFVARMCQQFSIATGRWRVALIFNKTLRCIEINKKDINIVAARSS